MRNLIENPTTPYVEYSAISNMIDGGKLEAKQYKGLLDLQTGKFYLRFSEIGTEPTNVPLTWVLQTVTFTVETILAKPIGATTQVHDEVGNGYTLYSEIL
jgi:hypothetical protein